MELQGRDAARTDIFYRLTRSILSTGRGERRSRNLFDEPQFICGVRVAAPGAGVPF
jgi:hypothetical protein